MEMNRRLQQIKTVWGWIQFPLLLLLLLAAIFWLHWQQDTLARQLSQQQRALALQTAHTQQQQLLLTNYMDTITDLIVHDKLLTATTLDPAAVIAQAQTQEVLRELDPDYKAKLMHFLYNTQLINNDHHVISMANADLRGAHLKGLDLRDTNLAGADLSGADLRGINLSYATLSYVNFSGADLTGANLYGSEMHNVNLAGANLTKAYMQDAFNLGNTSFSQAKSLSGAILPDGTKHS
jgi:uncharacterized protein YjbI with pentapeptide repeats